MDFFEAKHDLSEVYLEDELKEEIKLIIKEHQNIEKLKTFHAHPRHKIIFPGPPGVGKTLAAEALAKEMDELVLNGQRNIAKIIKNELK